MTRLNVIACIGFVIALGVAGTSDFEEAQRQAEQYCENVQSGVWADYNGTYDKFCESGKYTEK